MINLGNNSIQSLSHSLFIYFVSTTPPPPAPPAIFDLLSATPHSVPAICAHSTYSVMLCVRLLIYDDWRFTIFTYAKQPQQQQAHCTYM